VDDRRNGPIGGSLAVVETAVRVVGDDGIAERLGPLGKGYSSWSVAGCCVEVGLAALGGSSPLPGRSRHRFGHCRVASSAVPPVPIRAHWDAWPHT